MRRSVFILIAALIPILFGSVMMFSPELMLYNLTVEMTAGLRAVTQWVGFGVFSLGVINFLSRNDNGSTALKAVMVGGKYSFPYPGAVFLCLRLFHRNYEVSGSNHRIDPAFRSGARFYLLSMEIAG